MRQALSDTGTAVVAWTAMVLAIGAARARRDRERRVWALLAAALGTWAAAETVWFVYEVLLGRDVPAVSAADIGYLGAVPFAVAALAIHPATHPHRTRTARYLLDGLLLAVAIAFLSWTLVLGPLDATSDLDSPADVIALAYPFADVILLFFAGLAIRGTSGENRLPLWCLLAGIALMAVSDSTYAYLTGVSGYASGGIADLGWFGGYAAMGVAAFLARRRDAVRVKERDLQPTLAVIVAPFLIALLALTVAAVRLRLGSLDAAGTSALGLLIALVLGRELVLAREYAALAPNKSLSERLIEAATGSRSGGSRGWA